MNEKLFLTCHRLKNEILAELKLLANFSEHIQKIKAFINEKNWIELEKALKELHIIADNVEGLEAIRDNTFHTLLKVLKLSEEATIHRILPELDNPLRDELAELHQQLKIKVLKVKIEYQNLGYYLRNLSGFIYKFLEEVFPHTKGKIYSRQGKAAKKVPESIMINKKL